jgi:hypothetical protein
LNNKPTLLTFFSKVGGALSAQAVNTCQPGDRKIKLLKGRFKPDIEQLNVLRFVRKHYLHLIIRRFKVILDVQVFSLTEMIPGK